MKGDLQLNKNIQDLIIKFNLKLKDLNLNNCDKQTLLDFIYLFDLINSKEFLYQIINNLNNLPDERINYELNLKLENLYIKLITKKYVSKTENSLLRSYTYLNRHEIYFLMSIDVKFLIDYIINNLKFEINDAILTPIELYFKKNSKYVLILVDAIDNFQNLNNITLSSYLENFFKLIKITDYDCSLIKLRLNF